MPGVRHARGTQLKLELISWDEVDLSVQARVLEVSTVVAAMDTEVELEEADITDETEQAAEQTDGQAVGLPTTEGGEATGIDGESPGTPALPAEPPLAG